MISQRDVEFYRDSGYVVVPDLLDAATLSAARQVIAELIEGARGVTGHTAIYDLEPSHRPEAPRVRRIKTPHLHHELFRRIMRTRPPTARDGNGSAMQLHAGAWKALTTPTTTTSTRRTS